MRVVKSISLVVLLLVAACQQASAAVKVGEPAPLFTATDSFGKQVSLADFKGKYVVLEWTNNGCPFVQKHYRTHNMQDQQKEATGKGAVWLTIISSAPGKEGHVSGAEANKLTKDRGASPTAVLLDEKGEVGHLYGAKTTPHMFVVDPGGKLIYAGGIDSIASADDEDLPKATQYVRVALDEAMAGKPVSQPVTANYGCSVKY
ncbi:MAG TPA: thioredoxin family protein [Nevskiaceae bacterium]|nr:thioredoxin family protein [Nevskiaceae bacterium]